MTGRRGRRRLRLHGTTKKRSRDYSCPTLRLSSGLLGVLRAGCGDTSFVTISVDGLRLLTFASRFLKLFRACFMPAGVGAFYAHPPFTLATWTNGGNHRRCPQSFHCQRPNGSARGLEREDEHGHANGIARVRRVWRWGTAARWHGGNRRDIFHRRTRRCHEGPAAR